MAETRILLLSNRDFPTPEADEPPPHASPLATIEAATEADTSRAGIGEVAAVIVELLGQAPGVRIAHLPVCRPGEVLQAVRRHRPHVVFNLCESLGGDSRLEVAVPWMLARLGVPTSGSPFETLRHCLFKAESARLLTRAGVRVPATVRVSDPDHIPEVPLPAIVKPEREDGSLGIAGSSLVHDRRTLRDQVAAVVELLKQPAVVQRYIHGREISVSLLGWPTPRVLPLGEITFHDLPPGYPHILTYRSKWCPDTIEAMGTPSVAAVLRPHEQRRVAATGRRAFDVLGLRDYGRVDLRLSNDGVPYVIDVNPNCDLSPDGGFARAAERAGLSYEEVIWEIVRSVMRRAPQHDEEAQVVVLRGRARRPIAANDAAGDEVREAAS